ncbi:hypothetical protein KIN20_002696 [Parelaphostrongylus tenuis]|uniref:Uncharacterized protein n=1 Tax=Parelaphostrongylus tenuis TaxID=148309 RepID=A0AAD5M070_PARTN|nr:hypothetical protein KIN20_002696 [Parelaphostrongylus tenuis]
MDRLKHNSIDIYRLQLGYYHPSKKSVFARISNWRSTRAVDSGFYGKLSSARRECNFVLFDGIVGPTEANMGRFPLSQSVFEHFS